MANTRALKSAEADAAKKVSLLRKRVIEPGTKRKATLVLTTSTDIKLTVASKIKGVDRSDLAEQFLATGLADMEITVRGKNYDAPARQDEPMA
jgi:hypothetical protein